MVEEYGNQKLGQEKMIVNGKQVKDLWKMESQGLANHGGDKRRRWLNSRMDKRRGGREGDNRR